MHSIENRIKEVLKEKKKTQKWLAEKLGFESKWIVTRWCNNDIQPSTVSDFLHISEILKVKISDLLIETDYIPKIAKSSIKESDGFFYLTLSTYNSISYTPTHKYEQKVFQCWLAASRLFQSYTFENGEEKVIIQIDWNDLEKKFRYVIDGSHEITLQVIGNIRSSQYIVYASKLIDILFLTMNISVPGSINFYKDLKGKNRSYSISLSSVLFEIVFRQEQNYTWPIIHFLPLEKVLLWYEKLNIGAREIARTPIENCLFSLINVCQSQHLQSDFLWITHALEAFYCTSHSGILESLRTRILLFLGAPISNSRKIQKRINEMYDVRSSFVHGSLKTQRYSRYRDNNYDNEDERKLSESFDLGMTILLSSLQKMVENNAKEISFSQQYHLTIR